MRGRQCSTFRMFSTGLTCLFFAFAALVNAVLATDRVAVKRDDNLPARVPYIFPPPGTDAVCGRGPLSARDPNRSLQVADSIRARRVNGTLLDLDGVL